MSQPDKDREAFEAWCNQERFRFQFGRGLHSLIYDNPTTQDMWVAWQAARDHYAKEIERLQGLVYVPGLWKCAKCGCTTVCTNLHVDTGGFSANNNPQQCPNNCGPMWRVTERDAGNDLADRFAEFTDKYAPKLTEKEAVENAARSIYESNKEKYWPVNFEDAQAAVQISIRHAAKAALRTAGVRFKEKV